MQRCGSDSTCSRGWKKKVVDIIDSYRASMNRGPCERDCPSACIDHSRAIGSSLSLANCSCTQGLIQADSRTRFEGCIEDPASVDPKITVGLVPDEINI